MSSQQSKDNTCKACGGKGYYINGIDPRANVPCTACQGSGVVEWNPHGVEPGYCKCGCGEKTPIHTRNYHDRGIVKGQPADYIRFHKGRTNFTISETGCWVWKGGVDKDGYAATRWNYKGVRVHRAIYELLVGPVPAELQIDHLCRNTSCVNPAHLEPVTAAVNRHRGDSTKLTSEQVKEIRASNLNNTELGKIYGVDHSAIYKIRKGLRWTN